MTIVANEKVQWYKGNRIRTIISERGLALGNEDFERDTCQHISQILGVTKRLTAILNNTFPPTIEELVVISSILGVTIDELIITSEVP